MTVAAVPTVTDLLRRAATRAALAPSVHNTQPWLFVVAGDALEIHANTSRQLHVLDPRSRQLVISCGCAVFNARVALAAAGYEANVARTPDPSVPGLMARITLGAAQDWVPIGALDDAIDVRRTNRYPFADETVPAQVVYELLAAGRAEAVSVTAITNEEQRLATARLSRVADRVQNADPAYVEELRAWTTDDRRRRDGVQAASVPYGGVLADAHDDVPVRHFDVRGMGWLPPSSGSDADQCMILFAVADDVIRSWLRMGEALEHVWLELTRQGYAASPLNQVVETVDTRDEFRAALHTELHPGVLLRVGRAPIVAATRRLLAGDVLTSR